MAPKPSRDMLIHCDACGEDYSSTYRRCPFCGERNDPRRVSGRGDPASASRYIPTPPPVRPAQAQEEDLDDGYVFDGQDAFEYEEEEEYYAPRPKGGKRLAPKQGGQGFDLPPINWPRLITFLCSLVIIVAALVIVFTVIYPQLRGNQDPASNASESVSPSLSPTPDPIPTPDPANSQDVVQPTEPVNPTPDPTTPVTTPPPTGGQRATIVNASGGLRVRSGPGMSYNIVASLLNGNVINVIAPSDNGWYQITFSGSGGAVLSGYIMGDYISTIAGSGTTSTQPPATNPPVITTQAPSPGGPTVGRAGTIVNADGGLNVRPDPSRSNPPIASLVNGNTVQVVSDAGGGWYEVTFSGRNGSTMRGYIMGEYISTN